MKAKNKTITFILAVLCIICFSMYLYIGNTSKALAEQSVSGEFKVLGASALLINKGEEGAIRFGIQCSEDDYELIKDGAKSAVLLMPTDILGNDELTVEYKKTVSGEKYVEPRNVDVSDLWVKNGNLYTAYVYMRNIPEDFYNYNITARAYIKFDGEQPLYSNSESRSLAYVAGAAIADGMTETCLKDIVDSVVDSISFAQNEIEADIYELIDMPEVSGNLGIPVTYEVEDSTVAKVVDGKVVALKAGETEVYAVVGNVKSNALNLTIKDIDFAGEIAKGSAANTFVYKGSSVNEMGVSIGAGEQIIFAKSVSYEATYNRFFNRSYFTASTLEEGTEVQFEYISKADASKRFAYTVIKEDGNLKLTLQNTSHSSENKYNVLPSGEVRFFVNKHTNESLILELYSIVGGFTVNDNIEEMGEMILIVKSNKAVMFNVDYLDDTRPWQSGNGYNELKPYEFFAIAGVVPLDITTFGGDLAKGTSTDTFVYKGSGTRMGVSIGAGAEITFAKAIFYKQVNNTYMTQSFFDITTMENGTEVQFVYISRDNSSKRFAYTVTKKDDALYISFQNTNVESEYPINSEVLFKVDTSFGVQAYTGFIPNDDITTMGDMTLVIKSNKAVRFEIEYLGDTRPWSNGEFNNVTQTYDEIIGGLSN